jgi:hypothetical protein
MVMETTSWDILELHAWFLSISQIVPKARKDTLCDNGFAQVLTGYPALGLRRATFGRCPGFLSKFIVSNWKIIVRGSEGVSVVRLRLQLFFET